MENFDDMVKDLDAEGGLDLSHQNYQEVDDGVWEWGSDLITLTLSYNSLTALAPGVACLSNVREINLACNQLTDICPEIGECLRLRILKLNGNRLRTLPAEIGKCSLIEELILSENHLHKLPEEIGQLKNMKILHLQNNQLEEVQPAVGEILGIEDIDCSNNPPLKNIPLQLQADTHMILWCLQFQRKHVLNMRSMEATNSGLEVHAVVADKERLANLRLREELEKLRQEKAEWEEMNAMGYFKLAGSKACILQ
jgi:hypothetical protein